MKKSFVLGAAMVMALGVLATPPAHAACAVPTPMNQLFVPITSCPDPDPGATGPDPVVMYSYLIASPTGTNSNGLGGMCWDNNHRNGILQDCTTAQGIGGPGDGNVAVQFDWQAPGTVGCPSTTLQDGDNPVAISVVASNGTGAFITVGASSITAGYVVDLAFPFDPGSGLPQSIACTTNTGVKYTSGAAGGSVCVNAQASQIVSDCDPNSTAMLGLGGTAGSGASCLDTANKPTAARGKLYTKEAACKTSPDLRVSGWTALAAAPDASGDACNPVPSPVNPADCMFIGTTTILGGVESPAITGLVQIPGPGAAGDKVSIKTATLDQGKLNVNYSTENEMTIVGFNVYAGNSKLNTSLISAKGTGSNSYTFSVGRGAVKNNRTVTVEAVLSNGATVRSNTVTLK